MDALGLVGLQLVCTANYLILSAASECFSGRHQSLCPLVI